MVPDDWISSLLAWIDKFINFGLFTLMVFLWHVNFHSGKLRLVIRMGKSRSNYIAKKNRKWKRTYAVGQMYLMCGCLIISKACDQPCLSNKNRPSFFLFL